MKRLLLSPGILTLLCLLTACIPPLALPDDPHINAALTSMDGLGTIAYVLDGDIWIKRLPDGEAQRITEDGVNHSPTWSYSGQWLAFRKMDSQLWVYSLAENQATAVESGAPVNFFAWSPTEDRLALNIGSGVTHLRLWAADKAESTLLLAPDPDAHPGRPTWSKDGEWLAYEWSRFDPVAKKLFNEIHIVSANGGEAMTLLSADMMEQGSLQIGGWSPQGDQLLFWYGPRPIDSFLPDTIDLMLLPVDPTSTLAPSLVSGDISWWFIGDIASAPPASAYGSQNAVAVTAGGGPPWTNKRIALTNQALTPADQVAIQPAWSPDGESLAYSGMPDPGDLDLESGEEALWQRRIWLIDSDGESDPWPITAAPAYRDEYPQWSTDGTRVLFARVDTKNEASLWLLPTGGGAAELLVPKISLIHPPSHSLQQIEWQKSFDWYR